MTEDTPLLHKVHNELVAFRAETQQRHVRVNDLLNDHHETLYGDGNGRPGLRVRTDRLEQKAKRGEKHFWAVWAAAVGAAFSAVVSWWSRP